MNDLILLSVAMLATGCVAGVLAGLFGIGGGIVIVPVLEAVLGVLGVDPAIRMHVAVATSLATIIPTSISSARAHHQRGAVDIDLVKRWSPFVLAGSVLGVWIAAQLHSQVLAIIFATLAFVIALKMIFFPDSRNLTESVPRKIWVPIIPGFIGCSSSMMGIGGGTFSVMTLTIFNMPIHRAVGTASLFGLAISLPGTVAFIAVGLGDPRLPTGNLGFVNLLGLILIAPTTVLCAPLGAKLAHGFSAKRLSILFGLFLLIAAGRLAIAEEAFPSDPPNDCYDCEEWNRPHEPFRVFGNTYYVGTAGLSAILIDGGSELVLIDGGLPQSAALVASSIRTLGFDPENITTILLSHAHFDHAGGINALQRYTGARVLSSEPGAQALRAGDLMADDPQAGQPEAGRVFPAVSNVYAVEDNSTVTVGDAKIVGVYTPGHTPGGMSWTWETCEENRCLNVVYADSFSAVSAEGYRFSEGLGKAIRTSANRIAALDCDIMIATHSFIFDLDGKFAAGRDGFVDSSACANYGQSVLRKLQKRLAKENSP